MRHFSVLSILAAVALGWVVQPRPVAAAITRLGVLGDSLSDEYFEASYGSYARNWPVLFDQEWGINLGPTAAEAGQQGNTWGNPRRSGFEYNWALAGATSSTLLSGGQHTGLANQVTSAGLSHAVMLIGANDFAPGSTAYSQIYSGGWSASQIESYVAGRVANVTTALDTVLPTGVKLVLGNFPDYAVAPATKASYPDPVKRDLVTAVVAEVNNRLLDVAQDRHLPLLDVFASSKAIFGTNTQPKTILLLGNTPILLASTNNFGANPQAAFVHDGVHIMTTIQGLLGNLILTAFNEGYDTAVPLASESQLLSYAGLSYGGADTLESQIGPLSNFIYDFTPQELVGDANGDCQVGAADYAIWAAQFGRSTPGLAADFDGNGSVGAGDYALWAANFGKTCSTGAAAGVQVPEPAGWGLAVWGAAAVLGLSWRRRRAPRCWYSPPRVRSARFRVLLRTLPYVLAGLAIGIVFQPLGATADEATSSGARVYEHRLTLLENAPPLLADHPQFVAPVEEVRRYEAPRLIDDAEADLEVRAWRYSYHARGIIEMSNRLAGAKTAVIVVHPWGIDDGQGWRSPEPAGTAFACTPEKNQIMLDHAGQVIQPLLAALRPRVAVVGYSLPGREDPIRARLYRSARGRTTSAERAAGQAELAKKLAAFDYRGGALPEQFSLTSGRPAIDYFRAVPGLDATPPYDPAGFWELPIPVMKPIEVGLDDVVFYDGDGYELLRDFLRHQGVEHVLLAGYHADMCVCRTTAGYDNLREDFNTFLVGDAVLATMPANDSPRHATNQAVSFASLKVLVTQASWIRPLATE